MAKLIPSQRTLDAARAALDNPAINAELGRRAGLPMHQTWMANLQELRHAIAYNEPINSKAIDGAMALHDTLRLGGIGLDFVRAGQTETDPSLKAHYEMHKLVDELRTSILQDQQAQKRESMFSRLGRAFRSILPS